MSLRINDIAPDFLAETSQGPISFYQWIGEHWVVLFSHPKNFTPVCTTELGAMAGLEGDFHRRGVKIIGISVGCVIMTGESRIRILQSNESFESDGHYRFIVLIRLVRFIRTSSGAVLPTSEPVFR